MYPGGDSMTIAVQRLACRILLAILCIGSLLPPATSAAEECAFFPETGYQVCGVFLTYWRQNGGLPVFGFPIAPAQPEVAADDGKSYLTQWFERNRFEHHPENAGTKYEVLLGRLGVDLRREATAVDPDFRRAARLYSSAFSAESQAYFEETGHNLRFGFLTYWREHGGLELLGLPISEEYLEYDEVTGRTYVTQWFERARMEYHPENADPQYQILLGLLGNEIRKPREGARLLWRLGSGYSSLNNKPIGVALDDAGHVYVVESARDRVRKLTLTGQIVAEWGETGSGKGQFAHPTGIALGPTGDVYVLDSGNRRIQKFTSVGQHLVTLAESEIYASAAIAVDKSGNIYTENGDYVVKRDPSGRTITLWNQVGGGNSMGRVQDIALDPSGDVYASDTEDNIIHKFDANGRYLTSVAANIRASGLAVDRSGNLYALTRSEVVIFDRSGQRRAKWSILREDDSAFGRIAVDKEGRILITDTGAGGLLVYDANGNLLSGRGPATVSPGTLQAPLSIAVDNYGNLYVGDVEAKRVEHFGTDGRHIRTLGGSGQGPGQFSLPTSIAVDRAGRVYVADAGNDVIQVFTSDGQLVARWGTPGQDPTQFPNPVEIALDLAGNVYVLDADSSVQKLSNDGRVLGRWGSSGNAPGQFSYPLAMAADGAGNLYIVDGYSKIHKFTLDGRFLGTWDATPGALSIAIDGKNAVYLCSSERCEQFTLDGRLLRSWGKEGSAAGQFLEPYGIAIDSQGNVYVADMGNALVQKFAVR
jgi:sugar lactone lactonase YvrE